PVVPAAPVVPAVPPPVPVVPAADPTVPVVPPCPPTPVEPSPPPHETATRLPSKIRPSGRTLIRMGQQCPTTQMLVAICRASHYGGSRNAGGIPTQTMGHLSDVLFLDDDDNLRATFADLVKTIYARECHGIGTYPQVIAAREGPGIGSYRELLSRGEQALHCGVAILDINLGPEAPSGIDSYGWLRKHGFHGRIVVLTSHAATHPLVREAQRLGDAEVIGKPVSLDRLTSMLEDQPSYEAHPPQ